LSTEISIEKPRGIIYFALRQSNGMKKSQKKLLKRIRKIEAEIVGADPSTAAKWTQKLVKWKADLFD